MDWQSIDYDVVLWIGNIAPAKKHELSFGATGHAACLTPSIERLLQPSTGQHAC